MGDFLALPIRVGDGNVHVNYFRTFIRPYRGATLPTGAQLLANMPKFMSAHTAAVWKDSRRWHAQDVLTFRGVARVRPFLLVATGVGPLPGGLIPIPLSDELARIGIPESIRQLMIPQWHTDSVGLARAPFAHAFTVQTLKREFETDDDRKIRRLVGQQIRGANASWIDRAADAARTLARFAIPGVAPMDDAQQLASTLLGNWAVMINQHHFLAGRRSFLIGTAAGLEFTGPGVQPGDWVFETAALERYSLATYGYATNLGMGGAARVVRPVWMEMGQQLARVYGQPVGPTIPLQVEFGSIPAATGSAIFADVAARHKALVPGLP